MHLAPLMQLRLSLHVWQSGCIASDFKSRPAEKIIHQLRINILWLGEAAGRSVVEPICYVFA